MESFLEEGVDRPFSRLHTDSNAGGFGRSGDDSSQQVESTDDKCIAHFDQCGTRGVNRGGGGAGQNCRTVEHGGEQVRGGGFQVGQFVKKRKSRGGWCRGGSCLEAELVGLIGGFLGRAGNRNE